LSPTVPQLQVRHTVVPRRWHVLVRCLQLGTTQQQHFRQASTFFSPPKESGFRVLGNPTHKLGGKVSFWFTVLGFCYNFSFL